MLEFISKTDLKALADFINSLINAAGKTDNIFIIGYYCMLAAMFKILFDFLRMFKAAFYKTGFMQDRRRRSSGIEKD